MKATPMSAFLRHFPERPYVSRCYIILRDNCSVFYINIPIGYATNGKSCSDGGIVARNFLVGHFYARKRRVVSDARDGFE